jgi:hypothetical protein
VGTTRPQAYHFWQTSGNNPPSETKPILGFYLGFQYFGGFLLGEIRALFIYLFLLLLLFSIL